jgi:hypothetical protein
MTEHREIAAAEILDWNRAESPLIRVRIPRDTVPGRQTPYGSLLQHMIY